MNHRNWWPPVSLSWNTPVPETILSLFLGHSLFLQPSRYLPNPLFYWQSIKLHRINQLSLAIISLFFNLPAGNHFHNRQLMFLSKFPIPLIMSWYPHDRSCTITHDHIISHPNRNFLFGRRINHIGTRKNPCLLPLSKKPLHFRLSSCLADIRINLFLVFSLSQFLHPLWLWGQNKESGSEGSVWPGGKGRNFLFRIGKRKE